MENKTLTQTVETKVEDKSLYPILDYLGNYYSYIERTLYNVLWYNKDSITKDFLRTLRLEYIKKYKISSRFYNSLLIAVKGYIKLDYELFNNKINNYKIKINNLNLEIKKNRKKLKCFTSNNKKELIYNSIVVKQRKIDRLTNLVKTIKIKKRIFGSKLLYKSQFTNNKYINNHDLWLKDWRLLRNYSFNFVGSKYDNNGNQLCQYYQDNNNEFLKIRLPDIMSVYGKYVDLSVNLKSNRLNKKYYNNFRNIINNFNNEPQALSYRFYRKSNGFWYVACTYKISKNVEYATLGCNGIDINYGLISNTTVDCNGNFLRMKNYYSNPEKLSSKQMLNLISLQLDCIVFDSKNNGYRISMEDLELSNKKLFKFNKKINRKICMIPYSKILALLISKCFKNNVELVIVNPAYTSVIGFFKYRKMYGISKHNAAAMVIARRGLSLKDKIGANRACVLQSGENKNIDSKNSWNYIFRHKHYWSHWSYLKKNLEKCSKSIKKFLDLDPLICDYGKTLFTNLEDLLSSRFSPNHFSFVVRLCNL